MHSSDCVSLQLVLVFSGVGKTPLFIKNNILYYEKNV